MDGVFGVDAHDLLGHGVVGLGDVTESLAEDDVAESRLFDSDKLTAAWKSRLESAHCSGSMLRC